MDKFNFKKLILCALVLGVIMFIPFRLIKELVYESRDIELMYSILKMSLMLNIFLITFPFIFRYASKSKDKDNKKE